MTPRKKTPTAIELLRRDLETFKRSGRKPKATTHHLQPCLICGHKAPRSTMHYMGRDVKHGGEEMYRCHGCYPGSEKWIKFLEGKPEYEGWYQIFCDARKEDRVQHEDNGDSDL